MGNCDFLQPAGRPPPSRLFLWLLLEGVRGEVGVLLGIEAGAVFLHPGEVAVAENLRVGVIVLQAPEEVEQGVLLGWCPGVGSLTVCFQFFKMVFMWFLLFLVG